MTDNDFDVSSASVLGRVEIAKLLRVETRTPHAWTTRGLLPDPDFEQVNGGPAWNRATIVEWAVRTGRLPEYLAEEGAQYGEVAAKRGGRS
jgi:hypothetical protein